MCRIAGADFSPSRARLNLEAEPAVDAGWSPAANDRSPYLTVDLGGKFEVSSVITQGGFLLDPETLSAQPAWVTSLRLETSLNGLDWDSPAAGKLQGNDDAVTPAMRELALFSASREPIHARFVRFKPLECALGKSADGSKPADDEPVDASKNPSHCSLRVEILGRTPCKGHTKCSEQVPLGIGAGGLLPDSSFAASSRRSSSTPPHAARLHSKPRVFAEGGWSPGQCPFGWNSEQCAKAVPWLQVDLGASRLINAVATQGSASRPSWVSAYTLSFSNDGRQWAQLAQPLRGNSDALQVVKNPLPKAVVARYVRFLPVEWHGTGNGEPCAKGADGKLKASCGGTEAAETFGLRVELFGPDGYRQGELGCRLQNVLTDGSAVDGGLDCHCHRSGLSRPNGFKQPLMVLQPTEAGGDVGEEVRDKKQCACGRHIPRLLRGSPTEEETVVAGGLPPEIMRKTAQKRPVEKKPMKKKKAAEKLVVAQIVKSLGVDETKSQTQKVATLTLPAVPAGAGTGSSNSSAPATGAGAGANAAPAAGAAPN